MPISYKTPGIYIEEVPNLPPQINYAGSALTAFIGYTQFATEIETGDLHLIPKRIYSLADYEQHFGKPQMQTGLKIDVSKTVIGLRKAVASIPKVRLTAKPSPYLMHYAMQLFFANGGNSCYIVSIGGYQSADTTLNMHEFKAGLDCLLALPKITILVWPEAQALPVEDYKSLHDAALAQCAALSNRFVIMDVPLQPNADISHAATQFRELGIGNQHLQYGAAYLPNLNTEINLQYDEATVEVRLPAKNTARRLTTANTSTTLDQLAQSQSALYQACLESMRSLPNPLPPSAAIAATYALVERQVGISKAPANLEFRLVTSPTSEVTEHEASLLNAGVGMEKCINVIRAFPGKGTRVWEARTLAGNVGEWRYVSISRMVRGIEASIANAMKAFVFDPNDVQAWTKIRGMTENFLVSIWRNGDLQGEKPEQAFYVKMSLGATMTAADIAAGRMVLEAGLATSRPAEFTILRIAVNVGT